MYKNLVVYNFNNLSETFERIDVEKLCIGWNCSQLWSYKASVEESTWSSAVSLVWRVVCLPLSSVFKFDKIRVADDIFGRNYLDQMTNKMKLKLYLMVDFITEMENYVTTKMLLFF